MLYVPPPVPQQQHQQHGQSTQEALMAQTTLTATNVSNTLAPTTTNNTSVPREMLFLDSKLLPREASDAEDDLHSLAKSLTSGGGWESDTEGGDAAAGVSMQHYLKTLQQPPTSNAPTRPLSRFSSFGSMDEDNLPLLPKPSELPRPPKSRRPQKKEAPAKAVCGSTQAKAPRKASPPAISSPVATQSPKIKPKPPLVASSIPQPVSDYQGSPQRYLEKILVERGYPIQRTSSKDAGYHKVATPLQLASFGTEVVRAANSSNIPHLSSLLKMGLSPNPTNNFGDDVLHQVCKRSNFDVFACLVQHGADLQVADSFGRTPLHHVAWSASFCERTAKMLMDVDLNQLFIQDQRNLCPLDYVRTGDWPLWLDFLKRVKDVYWPVGGPVVPRTALPRDKPRPPDPTLLSVDLAKLLSSGDKTPEEIAKMDEMTRKNYRGAGEPSSSLFNLLCK